MFTPVTANDITDAFFRRFFFNRLVSFSLADVSTRACGSAPFCFSTDQSHSPWMDAGLACVPPDQTQFLFSLEQSLLACLVITRAHVHLLIGAILD